MNLWLDDNRDPRHYGAIGYHWVKTVEEAKAYLLTGKVKRASLDHDLGACDACTKAQDERNYPWDGMAPNCSHFGTGYDLCLWMAGTGRWPKEMPDVHSANPVGAARMRAVIKRYFGTMRGEACTRATNLTSKHEKL